MHLRIAQTLGRLGIKALGAEKASYHWTEHREVGQENVSTEVASLEDRTPLAAGLGLAAEPILVREDVASRPKRRQLKNLKSITLAARSIPTQTRAGIEIGDWVTVRYVDSNRVRRLQISEDVNEPDNGVIWARSSLGAALLDAVIDNEVEYELKPGERKVVVAQAIEPAAATYRRSLISESVAGANFEHEYQRSSEKPKGRPCCRNLVRDPS